MPLQTGDRAPDVLLPSHTREMVSLGDLYRGQPTVLVFIPLAFSSTCTEELCTMQEDLADYSALNAQVVAISVDSPYALARYRADLGAEYLFLSDFNREASTAFGILREAPVGPGLVGASERAVYVIDTDGVIRYDWIAARPGLLPPFQEIRDAAARLAGAAA